MRLSPRGKIFCRGDEHLDRQLARIVVVPQQLGPQHRAVWEQFFHLMVNDPRDLLHARSTARTTPKVPAARLPCWRRAPGMQLAGKVSAFARLRAVAAAFAVVALGMAGCGGATSSHSAVPPRQVRPCAQLAAVSPGLLPVLAGLAGSRINLVANQPVRRQLLRFTGDAARWAAASGATAFTTLYRQLRHLWNWPSGLIPELAGGIRSDIAAAETHCATGGTGRAGDENLRVSRASVSSVAAHASGHFFMSAPL